MDVLSSALPHSVSIVAADVAYVNNGGHRVGAMKKVNGPARAELGRGTHNGYNGLGALPCASLKKLR